MVRGGWGTAGGKLVLRAIFGPGFRLVSVWSFRRSGALAGVSRFAIPITIERSENFLAPSEGAGGLHEFVLGDADGLQQSLAEVGENLGGPGPELAFGNASEDSAKGGTQVGSGNIAGGEEVADVAANFFRGLSPVLPARMEIAQRRMAGEARGAAAASVLEGEGAAGRSRKALRGVAGASCGFGCGASVFGNHSRRNFLECDRRAVFFERGLGTAFFECGRKAADRTSSRHGSLRKN